jgi:hypothetical protein
MSWFKVALTRLTAGEIVHVVVKVTNPDAKVDHLLVVLIVFFVSSAFGVASGSGATGDPQ